jgi:hypothetical protein
VEKLSSNALGAGNRIEFLAPLQCSGKQTGAPMSVQGWRATWQDEDELDRTEAHRAADGTSETTVRHSVEAAAPTLGKE